ncbi:MAG: PorP/SprF family type IX secretion system membrane protein [Paludibacteraceae bacterium]
MYQILKRLRNIKKQCLLALLFSLFYCLPAFSQFEAQLSQYMFNMPTFNPASVGENQMINVSGQHRIQWVGMPGAPQTTYFTINTPFKMSDKVTHGLGIKFLNDKIGAFTNQSAHLQYAYKRKIGSGTASLGMDLGFVSVGFVYDSIKNAGVNSEFHDFLGDTAIPATDETGMSVDLSLGAFYSEPKYYLGLSYVHFNAPHIKLNNEKSEFNVRSVVYLTGGYDLTLINPKFIVRSSSLVKSDFTTWQAELSSRLEFDKKYWGGLSYRFQDAVVVFAGLNVMNGLMVGYAYDLPTGKILTVSSGSHEIYLSYSFVFDTNKNKNQYKSIRIL